MANGHAETLPQVYARMGGLAYLIIIVACEVGEMLQNGRNGWHENILCRRKRGAGLVYARIFVRH